MMDNDIAEMKLLVQLHADEGLGCRGATKLYQLLFFAFVCKIVFAVILVWQEEIAFVCKFNRQEPALAELAP